MYDRNSDDIASFPGKQLKQDGSGRVASRVNHLEPDIDVRVPLAPSRIALSRIRTGKIITTGTSWRPSHGPVIDCRNSGLLSHTPHFEVDRAEKT